jgi:hypothetical protein
VFSLRFGGGGLARAGDPEPPLVDTVVDNPATTGGLQVNGGGDEQFKTPLLGCPGGLDIDVIVLEQAGDEAAAGRGDSGGMAHLGSVPEDCRCIPGREDGLPFKVI